MNKRGNIVESICGGVFLFVGICMLFGSVAAFISNQKFKEIAVEVQGVITEIRTYYDSDDEAHHDVWVAYSMNGSNYNEEINFYSSSMYEGKEIDLLVDPSYPTRVRSVSGNVFLVCILGGMGLIFSGVGGGVFGVRIHKANKRKRLIAQEHYVYAQVTGGYMCHNYSVNGRHPYKLECKYEDVFSGITHIFESDYIWEDPQFYEGREVKVFCQSDFNGDYYVDLESLTAYEGNSNSFIEGEGEI